MNEIEHEDSTELPFGGEPDEDSTENVIELLRKYDRELVRADKIPSEDSEDYLLRGYGAQNIDLEDLELEAQTELENAELEEFATLLRSTLTLIGISDPASVTPDALKEIDGELLEQLDPYNAESLFFEVAQRVRSRLGHYEPITWRRLVEQASPENRPVLNLDNLQLEQRLDAYSFLLSMNIDSHQLSDMVKSSNEMGVASPSRRQNVNRAAYFFEGEPILNGLVSGMRARRTVAKNGRTKAKKRVNYTKRERYQKPVELEKIIRMGQIILRFKVERLEKQKNIQANLSFDNEGQWDSIDHDVYRKMVPRLKKSLAISNLILAEMRIESVEELQDSINGTEIHNDI